MLHICHSSYTIGQPCFNVEKGGFMRTGLFAAILIACTFLMPAMGQSVGEIAGEVHDTTGAAIAEAPVTATNVDTNVARTTTTNSQGAYDFPGLIPGNYSVKAAKSGFK